ncbi:EAL domain-containing protein [Roseofilum sp. BLCC_M154]|uniref:EAL domain-containing protein n=1 Tax=Roseofilum acuticapitatum BLCC-M154 TaxID=3022444 RepID=A0ABT7AP18_9CYAN|nr:EAL domain-containing protein [Roseofilum acuticapitatum]MDJ1168639.1 EAL domain-containing protein [Roseofilum acuticapitatum BLCC-M154]
MKSKLYERLQTRRVHAGESIFYEGDRGDFAYIIEEGEVEIWTQIDEKRRILNRLYPGSMFGEIALIDGQTRSASATALTDVRLTVVTKEQVNRRIQDADPLLRMLLLMVMRYFRSETQNFRSRSKTLAPQFFLEKLYPDINPQKDLSFRLTEAVDLIRMENELRTALDEQQFKLVYQPIIDLETQIITGFEALIRWQSPKRGFVTPDRFIPLAESTSLIVPIGQWVMQTGLEALKKMQQRVNYPVSMSFNIASRQIEEPNFLQFLLDCTDQYGLNPQQVKLEILERTLFDSERAIAWVQQCHALGFPLVLDDFGTGYSSLQYLNEYNLDTLKIDKSFVQGMNVQENNKSCSICHAIVKLSKALEMTIIAEGIETPEHLQVLKTFGCNYGQGYFFSRPVSLEKAIALFDDPRFSLGNGE